MMEEGDLATVGLRARSTTCLKGLDVSDEDFELPCASSPVYLENQFLKGLEDI